MCHINLPVNKIFFTGGEENTVKTGLIIQGEERGCSQNNDSKAVKYKRKKDVNNALRNKLQCARTGGPNVQRLTQLHKINY